ncbi:DUF6789 family protein [Halobium salinum]|uniref:DUF6789 family protein n=1 Tax=Halobium salinum TaxID=1364940 RepID=A0ABD5PGI8_9EURY|nr:DUF6789 family protein [Halobium salinum]
MSGERGEPTPTRQLTAEEQLDEYGIPITLRVVAVTMGGGLLGMVLMLPLLVGVPLALDLFRTEPIVEFSNFGLFIGIEPSIALGIALFIVGGTTVLPLVFLVLGAFLPPEEPRYVRGATYATIFWGGFLFAFWPGGSLLTLALFVVVSLVSHWVYGVTLGYVLHRTIGIPQHDV